VRLTLILRLRLPLPLLLSISTSSSAFKLGTTTNKSGGIQGGISNGENIVFNVAFKPPATIGLDQQTSTFEGDDVVLAAKGRHDPCVVPRAISIVETMAALAVADAAMLQLARLASI
jgi:chorismate synthase